ncbi:nuclear transport factor 2 family protein [Acidiferrimicrobium sp. IK]|uniref:nuclear transport factor 2 family protein n=1 Tax=Acidiferrimicrobium sp. IK TaxID=2871700 RepID=UPI0021CAF832|nr:nuclear transport factor 2 family protein [Acidiferrimicrobium sp. IK]MCU4185062.1 nuclear transport factor 2 family protein [Acidiferrimicrobium sp. IK]
MTTTNAAQAFRAAVEGLRMDQAIEQLHPDAVFHSPIVHKPYVGRDAIAPILLAVGQVFTDFRYSAEFGSDTGHVLLFEANVGDRQVQGVDILQYAPDGRIGEFTVMVRPYSAATELRTRMAAMLDG